MDIVDVLLCNCKTEV